MTGSRYGACPKLVGLGALAALAPDLDVLFQKTDDPLYQLELHRQFSHSLLVAPVLAMVMMLLIGAWRGKASTPSREVFGALLLGLWSACLLDACTSYGTQLGWPLTTSRVAWNLVPVVDPLFTISLGALLAHAFLGKARLRWAWPLILILVFLLWGVIQKHRAEQAAWQLIRERGHSTERIVVKPTLGNQLLWRLCYIQQEQVQVDALRVGLLGAVAVYPGETAPLVLPERDFPQLTDSRRLQDLKRFATLSEGYLVRYPGRPNLVGDARYAMLPNSLVPLWGLSLEQDSPQFLTFRESGPEVRKKFWVMLLGDR